MPKACISFIVALVLAVLAGGCDFPHDPEGTTERVLERGKVRVGLVGDASSAATRALVDSIGSATSARAEIVDGVAEVLLPRVEAGDLDVVVGRFAANSPWRGRVAFTQAGTRENTDSDEPVVRAAVRNGENRWLMTVERAIRGGS
jgi:hypothetical protein